ncbi:DUF4405 domain-containing protein [Arcobacter sp. YIC-464]|uniref:DUF4405 domain-containing protein n=1 Tax=Arcobacter sp. YIC-464 TaxID=3376631 RepID=UPI003C1CF98A
MKTHKKRELATSFTTFLFLVIGTTGVMMYFHILDNYTKSMHEILGLVFVAIVFFHVLFNWKSMKNYFSNKVFFTVGGIISIIVLGFILTTSNEPSPKRIVFDSVFNKPIEKTSVLFTNNFESAKKKLEDASINYEANKSIKELALKNKISPFEIINILSKEQ